MRNGDWIKVFRAQRGWRCEVLFSAYDATQFTAAQHEYRASGRFALTAFIKGFIGHRLVRRRIEAAAKSLRTANGW